jgi:hypothetical protein
MNPQICEGAITEQEVLDVLMSLKVGKACGSDTLNLGPDEVDNLVYYFSKLLLRFGDEWNEMVMLVVRL